MYLMWRHNILICFTHKIAVVAYCQLLNRVRLFVTPWIIAHQAPLSIGLSRREYWSGLPFPSPQELPNPGTEPGSPALQTDSLPSELQGSSYIKYLSVDIYKGITHICIYNETFIKIKILKTQSIQHKQCQRHSPPRGLSHMLHFKEFLLQTLMGRQRIAVKEFKPGKKKYLVCYFPQI